MLVLTRKEGETIIIGDNIELTVVECHRDGVRIGINAPRSLPIRRGELEVKPRVTADFTRTRRVKSGGASEGEAAAGGSGLAGASAGSGASTAGAGTDGQAGNAGGKAGHSGAGAGNKGRASSIKTAEGDRKNAGHAGDVKPGSGARTGGGAGGRAGGRATGHAGARRARAHKEA